MTPAPVVTTHALARAREEAAADVEAKLAEFGAAFHDYELLTASLGARVGVELERRLEVPLVLHLRRAGLGSFLARQLSAGTPGSLRTLCEEQHARLLAPAPK